MKLEEKSEKLHNPLTGDSNSYNSTVIQMAKSLEWWLYERTADQDVVFTARAMTRIDTPVVYLPQRPDYHEFDVLTHLLLASWTITHYWEDLAKEFNQEIVSAIKSGRLDFLQAAEIAGYLHDIEKAFESRNKYDKSKVGEKGKNSKQKERILRVDEYNSIGAQINFNESISLKHALWKEILVKPTGDKKNSNGFEDFLHSLEIPDEQKIFVFEILKIYNEIDLAIISVAKGQTIADAVSVAAGNLSSLREKKYGRELVSWSCLVMAADNFAQGLPRGTKSNSNARAYLAMVHARNILLMNEIFSDLFQINLS